MKVVALFFVLFFVSIAYATFVESDYGTVAAKALIYNAKWFELIQIYLGFAIIYNIFST